MDSENGYVAIPGSDALVTRGIGEDAAVAALEALDRTAHGGREVNGEWLAHTTVRARFVPVLTDVFDRLSHRIGALEQIVYLHLYRLALGEERNFCRVSRAELCARTQLSDRRLGKALAALVDAGCVRPVHRDRVGTLYRVFLPHEVLGEPDRDAVWIAREASGRAPTTGKAPTGKAPTGKAPTGKAPTGKAPGKAKELVKPDRPLKQQPSILTPLRSDHGTPGALAAAFFERHGGGAGRGREDIIEAILDAMEAGHDLGAIERALGSLAKDRNTPVAEWPRFVSSSSGTTK